MEALHKEQFSRMIENVRAIGSADQVPIAYAVDKCLDQMQASAPAGNSRP